jgi:hypothetical protein
MKWINLRRPALNLRNDTWDCAGAKPHQHNDLQVNLREPARRIRHTHARARIRAHVILQWEPSRRFAQVCVCSARLEAAHKARLVGPWAYGGGGVVGCYHSGAFDATRRTGRGHVGRWWREKGARTPGFPKVAGDLGVFQPVKG